MEASHGKLIAGAWRRFFAFLIDICLVIAFMSVLSFAFRKNLAEYHVWLVLIGSVVTFSYFTFLNSTVGNGQTLGKRLLGIKVVNGNNETISVVRSFIRYFFLSLILSNSSNSSGVYPFDSQVLNILSIGLFIVASYLYIFNAGTRQTIHDLLVGTYVVNVNVTSEKYPTIWKYHYLIAIILFLGVSYSFVASNKVAEGFSVAKKAMKAQTGFDLISLKKTTEFTKTNNMMNPETKRILNVVLRVDEKNYSTRRQAQKAAKIVCKFYPSARKYNEISIEMKTGYDVGFASSWESHTFVFQYKDCE